MNPALRQSPLRSDDVALLRKPLVPSVVRAVNLLDRLASEREPMTLSRLASDLALPKSSVHGLCGTLVSYGYLRRQANGAFRIGPRVLGLAEAFVAGIDVAHEFNLLWSESGSEPAETVVLSVLSGTDALYVGVRNSARPLGVALKLGVRLPAYLSGSGKAMLAFLPAQEVRRRFAQGLGTRLTKKGPRDLDALMKELAQTKRRGYSTDDEGVREGVVSFGAPVFGAAGEPVAAVSVCINKTLLGKGGGARHRDAALAIAANLSERLGGSPAPRDPGRAA